MAFLNKEVRDGDNPDLTSERKLATFDTNKMSEVIYGSEKLARCRREISQAVSRIPELADTQPLPFLTRSEKILESTRKVAVLNHHLPSLIDVNYEDELLYVYGEVIGFEGNPLALHDSLFISPIISQGSDEQHEKWLGRAKRREIIGCYAQTELGHGSNLRKLETTATYSPSTLEFILHTPTITALKWWPGALGKSSNYAIVVATLIIKEHNYGAHLFMVQIRDEKSHEPLPGITVGDIGPKMAFNAADNGYLGFDNFRIPREHLLNRHCKVEPDGTYVKPPHSKMNYTGMIRVRSRMATEQGMFLAHALTIAVRYSALRRQGFLEDKTNEVKVLDYQTQQHRLFPSIARAYAFVFCGFETVSMYEGLLKKMSSGDTSGMADLHALTSGLKSVVTYQTGEGIEQARMACGGHGYSMASYISEIYGCAIGGCTYEGENMVMLLQLARYIVKSVELVKQGKQTDLGPIVAYLAERDTKVDLATGPEAYVKVFQQISTKQAFKATEKLHKVMESGTLRDVAWNQCAVELTRASRLHTRLYIMETFIRRVQSVTDIPVEQVLTDLLHLHLNYELLDVASYALENRFMTSTQMDYIKDQLYFYLEKIRPNAVSLVDSFQFSDMQLRSVLGRRDGHVYQNLFEWAKSSPLNKTDVLPSVDQYLKPMMEKAKL